MGESHTFRLKDEMNEVKSKEIKECAAFGYAGKRKGEKNESSTKEEEEDMMLIST